MTKLDDLFQDGLWQSQHLSGTLLNCDEPLVYVMQAGAGPFKIGTAKNGARVRRRLHEVQLGSPEPVVLRRLFQGGRDLEQALHAHYRAARIRGEWFRPTAGLHRLVVTDASPIGDVQKRDTA